MPRILAGASKGRRLKGPRGEGVRPTAARVRQSLFDILGGRLDGSRVLDLCAGTGTVGIEALSRGAETVVFVEKAAAALAVLRANLQALALPKARVEVLRGDCVAALRGLARCQRQFDLIFFDPPYDGDLYEPVLLAVEGRELLAGGAGVLVAEHFHKRVLPETIGRIRRVRTVRIGDHCLSLYRIASADCAGRKE